MKDNIEIWKPVIGYEGIYEISNIGRVKSLQRQKYKNPTHIIPGKIRPLQLHSNGYYSIMLCKNGITKRVHIHRLVASAFIPNPAGHSTVNHINYDRKDSRVENLEWCSQQQNILHATKRNGYKNNMQGRTGKLSVNSKPTYQIGLDDKVIKLWDSLRDAARELNFNYSSLRNCARGTSKKSHNFKWKYAQ